MLTSRERYERRRVAKYRKHRKYEGYHATLRAQLDPLVQAGLAVCARCGKPIEPGPWDLGHDDRTGLHSGPEHTSCNRGAPHRNVTSRVW